MTRTALGFLGLLVLLPVLQARDKPETPTPAEQYQALVKENEKACAEYPKALAKAKTSEEAKKVFEERFPWGDKFAPRFLELAEKYPKDPVAVDALVWIVTHVRVCRDTQRSHKASQILLRDHVQSEKMAALYPALGNIMLGHAQDKDSQQLLHAVLEKNKHRRAQALACLALAEQAEGCLRLARGFKDDPKRAKGYEEIIGKEAAQMLLKADLGKLSKEAESFYERIIKDFADVVDPFRNKLSGDIRNVRILATLEMSAVRTLSPLARETFPPRMILGWTIRFLLAMVRRVVGRIGLRRSATRAPADRLYATRPGLRR